MTEQNAARADRRDTALAYLGPLLVVLAFMPTLIWMVLTGGGDTRIVPTDDPSKQYPFVSPATSDELSGEAREGCLQLGLSIDDIVEDPETCLREYWTIDRLARSTRITTDWYADNSITVSDEDLECEPPKNGKIACELVGEKFPPLPPDDDPWWAEQAARDPGRVTMPGLNKVPVEIIRASAGEQ